MAVEVCVGMIGRLRRLGRRRGARAEQDGAATLAGWARVHRGVEAFVEPPSKALPAFTVVLVAHDGEWTRQRVAGAPAARRLGQDLAIPVYDVWRTGYPQRMRDHDARLRILRERERRSGLE